MATVFERVKQIVVELLAVREDAPRLEGHLEFQRFGIGRTVHPDDSGNALEAPEHVTDAAVLHLEDDRRVLLIDFVVHKDRLRSLPGPTEP